MFNLDRATVSKLRETYIGGYIETARSQSSAFASYSDRTGFKTGFAEQPIAYIPTSAFKTDRLLIEPAEEVEKWCRSSGTRGPVTVIGRSRTALERLLGSVRLGLSLLEERFEEELNVIHLGPCYEESGDVWVPYV